MSLLVSSDHCFTLLPISNSNSHSHSHFFTLRRTSINYSLSLTTPTTAASDGPRPRPFTRARMDLSKDKLVVIMGATGTGKSRLSIDLASHFPIEVINSDKMQVYKGLDVTTNKILPYDRRGVPHHLLGDHDSPDFTRSEFRSLAGRLVSDVTSRRRLPVVVGGSNSFLHALLSDRFDLDVDVFGDRFDAGPGYGSELRYSCCFLWVHVSSGVLRAYLDKRVDEMLDSGMFGELAEFYDSDRDPEETRTGIRKAIGVPEFDRFFGRFRPDDVAKSCVRMSSVTKGWDQVRRRAYEEAVGSIKENTWQLARRQVGKIMRLRNLMGWDLRRIDSTEAFRTAMRMTSRPDQMTYAEVWERQVLDPSVNIVKRFLDD